MPVSAVKDSSSGAINSSERPEYSVIDPASLAEVLDESGEVAVSLAHPARKTEKLSVKAVTKRRDNRTPI
jgi:hypothetical protein